MIKKTMLSNADFVVAGDTNEGLVAYWNVVKLMSCMKTQRLNHRMLNPM